MKLLPNNSHSRTCIKFLVFAGLLLWVNYGASVCLAEPDPNVVNAPATPSEALAANVAGYRIVNGVAIYPILPGNDEAVQALLAALSQDPDFQGIKMTLYVPIGTKPKILLSGQGDDALRYAVQKLKTIMSRMGQPHRLVVAAYLRELTVNNDDTVGMSWFANGFQGGLTVPNVSTVTTTGGVTAKADTGYTLALSNVPANIVANLTRTMSRGKVIVGSEITIVNGATAELKNDDSTPVPLKGSNGVTFNTQTISSDVKITPTIVNFNAEKPQESIVRLNVVIQLSVPTDTVTFGSGNTASSALEYTTQTLTATHYVKANNNMIIGGLFASDTLTKSRSGVPILMNIPLLKEIFSTNTRSLQHMASILTLSVRILPVDKETGYDY